MRLISFRKKKKKKSRTFLIGFSEAVVKFNELNERVLFENKIIAHEDGKAYCLHS